MKNLFRKQARKNNKNNFKVKKVTKVYNIKLPQSKGETTAKKTKFKFSANL